MRKDIIYKVMSFLVFEQNVNNMITPYESLDFKGGEW